MRVILGICSVVSIASPVFADPVMSEKAPAATKSIDASIEESTQKISKLEARKDILAKNVNESQQRITTAYNAMKNAEADLMKSAGGATALPIDKQREILQKAKADYDKNKNEFAPAMLKAKADLASVDEELKGLSQTVKAQKFGATVQAQVKEIGTEVITKFNLAKLELQNKVTENRIRTADLRSAFLELDLKQYGVDATLDDMEKIYDKSVLGAYLQDKFGQLLNSQVVCSAVKRCGTADPKKIESEKIRKELFPESAAQAIRSDYYDKVNKKQATPVQ